MTEKQYDRLRDLLASPAPDDVVIEDYLGTPFSVRDIVLTVEKGIETRNTILKIVLDCKKGGK